MEINYWAVLVCAVASMAVGFVWYGPLFGKAWMKIMGEASMSASEKQAMMKNMWIYYAIQFVLSFITAGILAVHIANWTMPHSAVMIALCTWLGFVLTTNAGAALWSGKSPKIAWKMFFISSGAQLITFIVYGLILGAWM